MTCQSFATMDINGSVWYGNLQPALDRRGGLRPAARRWPVLAAVLLLGCGSQEAPKVSYEKPPLEVPPEREIGVPPAAPGQAAQISLPGKMERSGTLALSGEIPTSNAAADQDWVQVRFMRKNAQGKNVIHATGSVFPEKSADGRLTYRVALKAPREAGRYELVILAGKDRILARGEVDVQ